MLNRIIIRIIGAGFILGGLIHWLIILGILKETAPFFITVYFHSLAVFSPLTGLGLIRLKEWGRKLGFFIAITQIPAHLYMGWLDNFTGWESGLSFGERSFDIMFAIFYLVYFSRPSVVNLFKNRF